MRTLQLYIISFSQCNIENGSTLETVDDSIKFILKGDLIGFSPFLITCLFSFWEISELIYFYRKLCVHLAINYFSTVSWLSNSGMKIKNLVNVVLLLWLSLTYLRKKGFFKLGIYSFACDHKWTIKSFQLEFKTAFPILTTEIYVKADLYRL